MVKTLVRASCLLLPLLIYPPHGCTSPYALIRYVLKGWLRFWYLPHYSECSRQTNVGHNASLYVCLSRLWVHYFKL